MATQGFFKRDWTTDRVAEWAPHIRHLIGQPIRSLEIGVFEGRTAYWLLTNVLTHAEASHYGVDPYHYDNRVDLKPVFHMKARDRARLLANRSFGKFRLDERRFAEAARDLPNSFFDFIYVDGEHTAFACLQDMVNAWPLLKENGLMVVDDYGNEYEAQYRGDSPKTGADAFLSTLPPVETVWSGRTLGLKKLAARRS
jgi:hypothetical protein